MCSRKRRRTLRERARNAAHARARALERYGLLLDPRDLETVAKSIRSGGGRRVERLERGAAVWEVAVNGTLCRVIYDLRRKLVTTFLPLSEEGGGP